ncbi:MAG: hypothetical protein WD425_11780 [Nitrospirales bacterium]
MNISFPPHVHGTALILPFLFFGLMACQEETPIPQEDTSPATQNTPSTQSNTELPQGSSGTDTQTTLLGTVLAIEGDTYTIQNASGKSISVQPTASVLVDESLEIGDPVEVRYSNTQPIAVRKLRDETTSANDMEDTTQERLLDGTLSSFDKEKGVYTFTSPTGEKRDFQIEESTLLDESMEVGDQIEVSLSKDNHPIAIRKIRPQNQ